MCVRGLSVAVAQRAGRFVIDELHDPLDPGIEQADGTADLLATGPFDLSDTQRVGSFLFGHQVALVARGGCWIRLCRQVLIRDRNDRPTLMRIDAMRLATKSILWVRRHLRFDLAPSFTRGIGSTLDVVGMGDNRIGTVSSSGTKLRWWRGLCRQVYPGPKR